METYSISKDFIQALANYLGTKPWSEANPIFTELTKELNSEANKPKATSETEQSGSVHN